jgi:hypothetical protein
MHPLAINDATYGPAELKIINQAFDEAWQSIAGCFEEKPAVIERARQQLADAVLREAGTGITTLEALKTAALHSFAKDHEKRATPPQGRA